MAERVQATPALLKQRKELIEQVFGTIKRSMDQGHFLLAEFLAERLPTLLEEWQKRKQDVSQKRKQEE
jgi:hypothetical protein